MSVNGWIIMLVNCLALLTGTVAVVRALRTRFRATLVKTVSEPLEALSTKMDNFHSQLLAIQSEVTRAHDRLDRHLEVHSNASTTRRGA